MSNSADTVTIKVRRHPLFALGFLALGGVLVGLGIYFEQYALVLLGGLSLLPGVLAYRFPALVLTQQSIQLKNLFGSTGRTIPHDGLSELSVRAGKLVIVSGGRRAELPRPQAKALHRADWNFMVSALEQARKLKNK